MSLCLSLPIVEKRSYYYAINGGKVELEKHQEEEMEKQERISPFSRLAQFTLTEAIVKAGVANVPDNKSPFFIGSREDFNTNRKAAEHSAAEAALKELAKAGQLGQSISVPVHETGLCKSRLQEYAQKMHYAIPVYRCESQEKEGRIPFYTCSVEVGVVKYIGAGAKRKRDAEINAAITALSSIHAAASKSSDTPFESSQSTVVPCKKQAPERTNDVEEIARVLKAKVNHIGGGVTPHMDTLANALQIVIQSVQMVLQSSKEQSGSEPGQCATDGVARPARNARC